MNIQDLKNARLSATTAGYLTIYLKLSDLCSEASEITKMNYSGHDVDDVNKEFTDAISSAQTEVMKLVDMSITDRICSLRNTTEI